MLNLKIKKNSVIFYIKNELVLANNNKNNKTIKMIKM